MTKKQVKDSLIRQLELQGKTQEFYISLVNDYMAMWDMKEKLIKDIRKRGLRYEVTNGNGIKSEKPNESVQNLHKTSASMLKIITELNLKDPITETNDEEGLL